jgi:hypothetical protein
MVLFLSAETKKHKKCQKELSRHLTQEERYHIYLMNKQNTFLDGTAK